MSSFLRKFTKPIIEGLCICAMLYAPPAFAKTVMRDGVMTVSNDRGGSIMERERLIRDLDESGTSVRIEGRFCLSSCTMLVGLKNACIDPKTSFGFHGPSRSGRAIDQKSFEHFTIIMAAHYPPAIRTWFLQTGRYRIKGVYSITGAELIRHGVKSC
jgi:hypothetical protein